MRGMTTPPIHRIHSETGPMLFTDCPFCRQELAEDPAPVALPLAA